MSSPSPAHNERVRRALSQGQGGSGAVFLLLSAIAVFVVIVVLVAGLQRAELKATEAAEEGHLPAQEATPDIGS